MPDETWYSKEIDHLTRSGRYFKSLHLDKEESLDKDKETDKEKNKKKEKKAKED